MPAVNLGVLAGQKTGWGMDIHGGGGPLEMLSGGASIAWDTVPPLGGPLTLADGTIIPASEKILLAGQVMVEITAVGVNQRMFGSFDPAAADGRQTLVPGTNAGVLRKTVLYQPDKQIRFYDSLIGLVIGGPVIKDMVRATTGAASLTAGPTWAVLLAVLPRLILVQNLRGSHT